MELKQTIKYLELDGKESSNRTFMELKHLHMLTPMSVFR